MNDTEKRKKSNTESIKNIFLIFLILMGGVMCKKGKTGELIVIAHRGASRAAPENTLSAMKKAIQFGADYAECDVYLTKDGEMVLFHDEEMERTTGQTGMIWDYTLAELKELEVGSWFGEDFRGEPIPTLRQVIRLCKGKIKLNIEVKVSDGVSDCTKKLHVDCVNLWDASYHIAVFLHNEIHLVLKFYYELTWDVVRIYPVLVV